MAKQHPEHDRRTTVFATFGVKRTTQENMRRMKKLHGSSIVWALKPCRTAAAEGSVSAAVPDHEAAGRRARRQGRADRSGEDRVILSGIHDYYEPEELVGKTCIAITNLPPRPMRGIDSCGMLISAVHSEAGEEKLHLLMVDDHIPAGAKLY